MKRRRLFISDFQMFDCLLLRRSYTTLMEHVKTTVMRLLHLWRRLTALKCIFIASVPAPLSKIQIDCLHRSDNKRNNVHNKLAPQVK